MALLISCAKESDSYFAPLGTDAVSFARQMGKVDTWSDQFNDTITSLAQGESFNVVDNNQRFLIRTRYFFDSLYFRAQAYTQSNNTDIFGTKQDLVWIRFRENENGNDILSSYIALFPVRKDTVFADGSSSFFATDSVDWNGFTVYRQFILTSSLSSFEAVCDTTGTLLAFKTLDNRIYQPTTN